jgi:hypothetical protein
MAIAPMQYTLKKPPLSIMGMLMANPMMIMMVFMLIVVIGMPKLLQGMTPEELEVCNAYLLCFNVFYIVTPKGTAKAVGK